MQRLDTLTPQLFLDGPTEYLVKTIAAQIQAVPQFFKLFGDSIAPYERMDFSERELPALRIYNLAFVKESEDWFINGDVKIDVIWPASIRRVDLQQFPDTITSALIQQFRRTSFFNAVSAGVPGLNELGKVLSVNKELGFAWGDNIVPLTQITVNFRLDLRVWDLYMEQQLRTEDNPFEYTLQNLDTIVSTIQGLKDDNQTVEVTTSQEIDV